jgi:uncharacterized membrane protein (GlpM family)
MEFNLSNYLFHGILGAILFMLTYHFSVNKYSTLTALLPAIPLAGMYGLYLIYSKNGNVINYLTKISLFIMTALIFYVAILIVYIKSKNLLLALILGGLIWLVSCYFNLDYN